MSDATEPATYSPSHLSLHLIGRRQKNKFQGAWNIGLCLEASVTLDKKSNKFSPGGKKKKRTNRQKPFMAAAAPGVAYPSFFQSYLYLLYLFSHLCPQIAGSHWCWAQPVLVEPSPVHHPSAIPAPLHAQTAWFPVRWDLSSGFSAANHCSCS